MRVPIRKPGKYTHFKHDPRITPEKLGELKAELTRLKHEQPVVIADMQRQAQDGDFSENTGYQLAKARLRSINHRMEELEDRIQRAVMIDESEPSTTIQLGSTVTIEIDGTERTYKILGPSETNPSAGVISDASPIGSVLMGKKAGDTVVIRCGETDVPCVIRRVA